MYATDNTREQTGSYQHQRRISPTPSMSASPRSSPSLVSVRTVGNCAVPSYVPIRALIKPVFEPCPCQRVVTAVITLEKVVEKSPRARHVAGNAMFPSLFFDLFCMKQVAVGSDRQ